MLLSLSFRASFDPFSTLLFPPSLPKSLITCIRSPRPLLHAPVKLHIPFPYLLLSPFTYLFYFTLFVPSRFCSVITEPRPSFSSFFSLTFKDDARTRFMASFRIFLHLLVMVWTLSVTVLVLTMIFVLLK